MDARYVSFQVGNLMSLAIRAFVSVHMRKCWVSITKPLMQSNSRSGNVNCTDSIFGLDFTEKGSSSLIIYPHLLPLENRSFLKVKEEYDLMRFPG